MTDAISPKQPSSSIPNWAPFATVFGLTCLGFLGGIGVIPLGFGKSKVEKEASAATVAPAPTATAKHDDSGRAPAAAPPPALPELEGRPKSWAEAKSGEKISVQHLVVTYEGTALAANRNVHRTREQARARALEAIQRARKGEDFGKLVAEYSDEPGASSSKGRLDGFSRGQAVSGFADGAFALKPGQVSEPVETAFGLHVILRTK